MCQSYDYDLDNVAKVRAKFGPDAIVWLAGCEHWKDFTDEICLCGVDMVATAAKAGYAASNDHGGSPDVYELTPLAAAG